MSKGLKLTLMTVAVAIMAAQVMAMAPTIGEIPSPIVGDAENSTPANYFVWPDAFNLADYVTDDTSSPASIIWSYSTVNTAKYGLNGVPPLGAGDDPVNPPAGKRVNTQVLGGEHNPDNNPATITIRNVHLTPNLNTQGLNPGNTPITAEAQIVTLYASDGSSADSADVWFYTDKGNDHFSSAAQWSNVYTATFEGSTLSWVYSLKGGSATSSTANNTALCISTALVGDNFAQWAGPYGMLSLVKNNIYRIRVKFQGSQAAGPNSNVPFFDVTLNNFEVTGTSPNFVFKGLNAYGMNYFVLDNTGRANAILATANGTPFEFWWCPSAVTTAQWNNESGAEAGLFAAANAANKDSFMEFRVLDSNANGGITADNDSGSLCIMDLTIDRTDISALKNVATPLNYTSLSDRTASAQGNIRVSSNTNTTPTFASGTLTIQPTQAGASSCLVQVDPGDNTIDYGNPASLTDNYPVSLAPQKLYLVSMDLSAPTQADVTNCVDLFWVGADTVTNELINLTWVSASANKAGMPRTTVQTYKSLFYSNYASDAANPAQFRAFRPRFMMANDASFALPGQSTTPNGAIRLHNMKVEEVTVQ